MSKNYYYKMNKYKNKYLELKNKLGGGDEFYDSINGDEDFGINFVSFINMLNTAVNKLNSPINLTININFSEIRAKYIKLKEYYDTVIKSEKPDIQINNDSLMDKIIICFSEYVTNFNNIDIRIRLNNKSSVEEIIDYFFKEQPQIGGNKLETITMDSIKDIIATKSDMEGRDGKIYFRKDNDIPVGIVRQTLKNIGRLIGTRFDKDVVIKILKDISDTELNKEINLYQMFCVLGVGPQLYKKIAVPSGKGEGGYVMEKYTSDLTEVVSEYILTEDQITEIETRIDQIFQKIFQNNCCVPTDIKFPNMLINYTHSNKSVTGIQKIVFSDFDVESCLTISQNKENDQSDQKSDNQYFNEHKADILELFKNIVILSLIINNILLNRNKILFYFLDKQYKKDESSIDLYCLFKSRLEDIKIFLLEKQKILIGIFGYKTDISAYFLFILKNLVKTPEDAILISDLFRDVLFYIYKDIKILNLFDKLPSYIAIPEEKKVVPIGDYLMYLLNDSRFSRLKIVEDLLKIPELIQTNFISTA